MSTSGTTFRVGAGVPDGGRFAATEHGESGLALTGGPAAAPNRYDVEDARRRMDSLGSGIPPLYRAGWERINGGHGPTARQVRLQTGLRSETDREIPAARAEYQRLHAAYEASDKSQDDGLIRCSGCGMHFDELDGCCPTCGQ